MSVNNNFRFSKNHLSSLLNKMVEVSFFYRAQLFFETGRSNAKKIRIFSHYKPRESNSLLNFRVLFKHDCFETTTTLIETGICKFGFDIAKMQCIQSCVFLLISCQVRVIPIIMVCDAVVLVVDVDKLTWRLCCDDKLTADHGNERDTGRKVL